MREYLAALERLKRSTELLREALQSYSDALDPQIESNDDESTVDCTAAEVDRWLKQN